jgi:hypothetical protein
MIFGTDGIPEPPSDLVRRLAQVDPRLEMMFLAMAGGCWAFIERWGPNDSRYSFIQTGEMAPEANFDVLGYAPADVTAEDAFAILEKGLRQRDVTKADFSYFLDHLAQFNADQKQENIKPLREFAAEMVDANAGTISNGASVTSLQAGFGVEDGKVVGTPKKAKKGLTKSEREAKRESSDK